MGNASKLILVSSQEAFDSNMMTVIPKRVNLRFLLLIKTQLESLYTWCVKRVRSGGSDGDGGGGF